MLKVIKSLEEYIDILCHLRVIKGILGGGYLVETGWRRSLWEGRVVDKKGEPIPWCTYPFIDFIEKRISKEMSIFEYGSGASTNWYAERCMSVTALENDKEWYEKVLHLTSTKDNVEVIFESDFENYCLAINRTGKKYHIIIIDSIWGRNEAMVNSIFSLEKDGIIIVDDSEREEYINGISYLKENGFRQLDFYGLAATISYSDKCTSIFYRDNNIIGI